MQLLHPYFNRISPVSATTWREVAPLFQEQHLPKNTLWSRAGETARHTGILTRGVMRVFYPHADGDEYNKHFFTPISLAGAYASLVTGQPSLVNVQALTDCTLWVADMEALDQACRHFPEMESFARRFAERSFVQKEKREIEMATLDADARYRIFRQTYPDLEQQIPLYHIASYLGITPTQLSRIRGKMG